MGKYALLLVSALIFSLLTYSYALKNALFQSNTRTVQSYSQNQAHNIAQSAAMVAVNSIRNEGDDSDFSPGSDNTFHYPSQNTFEEWGDMHGEYRLSAINQGDSLLTIQSRGKFEDTEYVVNVGLVSTGSSGWVPNLDQAVHAENSILLRGSSSIQGDASINSINSGAVDISGGPQAIITGNLFIGPGGVASDVAPDKRSHWGGGGPGVAGGDIYVMEEELEYEMPEFPAYPNFNLTAPSVYVKGNGSATLNPSDYEGYYISEISVKSNTNLTINVGDEERTMFVGNFNIDQGHVNIVGDGKLNLYVVDDMSLGGSSSINRNGDVNNIFMFYGGQNELAFRGNTEFNGGLFAKTANVTLGGSNSLKGSLITGGSEVVIHGAAFATSRVVYAPHAEVELVGSGHIYGSVISDTFVAKGNAHVVYQEDLDSELPDLGGAGNSTGFSVVTFWN